uniref:Uncharacterized protein n=1 Tax=Anguilla anguilla TaxID=7936 RepID=A0A0E9VDG7_ANGAN
MQARLNTGSLSCQSCIINVDRTSTFRKAKKYVQTSFGCEHY